MERDQSLNDLDYYKRKVLVGEMENRLYFSLYGPCVPLADRFRRGSLAKVHEYPEDDDSSTNPRSEFESLQYYTSELSRLELAHPKHTYQKVYTEIVRLQDSLQLSFHDLRTRLK